MLKMQPLQLRATATIILKINYFSLLHHHTLHHSDAWQQILQSGVE